VHTGSLAEENGVRGREKGCDDGVAARTVRRPIWGGPIQGRRVEEKGGWTPDRRAAAAGNAPKPADVGGAWIGEVW
jgi:hypothetical protein